MPLRDGTSGKSRLAHLLDPSARRRLVSTLAQSVVETLLDLEEIEQVLVVTADPGFARSVLAAHADDERVRILSQPVARPGLNAALDIARERALVEADEPRTRGRRLLVVHADLPALEVDDVRAVLAEQSPVVVATDRLGQGTNLLALGPRAEHVSSYRFRFGHGSRAAHLAEAERLGVRAALVQRPGTATDLDTIEDWAELPGQVRDAVGLQVPALREHT